MTQIGLFVKRAGKKNANFANKPRDLLHRFGFEAAEKDAAGAPLNAEHDGD